MALDGANLKSVALDGAKLKLPSELGWNPTLILVIFSDLRRLAWFLPRITPILRPIIWADLALDGANLRIVTLDGANSKLQSKLGLISVRFGPNLSRIAILRRQAWFWPLKWRPCSKLCGVTPRNIEHGRHFSIILRFRAFLGSIFDGGGDLLHPKITPKIYPNFRPQKVPRK